MMTMIIFNMKKNINKKISKIMSIRMINNKNKKKKKKKNKKKNNNNSKSIMKNNKK